MTNVFQVAPGYNNAGGLVTIDPSPDTDGVQYPRTIYATDGSAVFDGKPFILLRFPDIESPADWVEALGQFGLSNPSVASARITIRLPKEDKVSWSNWNGIAVRPTYGQDMQFYYTWYQKPVITVRKLVAL